MSQQEMNYEGPQSFYGYEGDTGFEQISSYSMPGQKISGQAPTTAQRLTLALVSLGMLMGMSTLLAILATTTRSPGWVAVLLLFVLTLFMAAVVSINVVFNRRV